MDTPAIVMMIVALVTVWGVMAASIIHLSRHPEDEETGGPEAEATKGQLSSFKGVR